METESRGWTAFQRIETVFSLLTNSAVLPVLVMVSGAFARSVEPIWQYGLFGVLLAGIAAFLVLSIAMFLLAHSFRVWWPKPDATPPPRTRGKRITVAILWVLAIGVIAISPKFVKPKPAAPHNLTWVQPRLPIASMEELKKGKVMARTIFISQLPYGQLDSLHGITRGVIRKHFEGCELIGPALVHPMVSRFEQCVFGSSDIQDDVWIELKTATTVGAVPFIQCHFERCTFNMVSFEGDKATIDAVREDTTVRLKPRPRQSIGP